MIQYQELNKPLYSMQMTWNTVNHGQFYHPFEDRDSIFRVEALSDLTYEFFSCVDIAVNHILTKYEHLVKWHCGFLGGVSKEYKS